MEHLAYPRLLRRIHGAFLDGVVIPVAALSTLFVLGYMGIENGGIKALTAISVILLLEPVAVSTTGGTIGHHWVGIRVRKIHDDKRLNLGQAFVRFIFKTLCGLPAFLVALVTRRRQALHDVAARSVVVHKSVAGLPRYEVLAERTRADEHLVYASVWRRLSVVAAYWVILYFTWSLGVSLMLSSRCLRNGVCGNGESYAMLGSMVALLLVLSVLAIMGWRGLLYGCRKESSHPPSSEHIEEPHV